MPYKNPEDKRRWEREHREQRNTQRRKRLAAPTKRAAPDPISDQEPKTGWKTILAFAVGLGAVLLGAMSGIDIPIQRQP